MSLRESNTHKAKETLEPGFMKSDAKKAAEGGENVLDKAASYIPGQGKARDALDGDAKDPNITHDTGRQGFSGVTNALKPSGEQSLGEKAEQKLDQGLSHAQPDQDKSWTQAARDLVTPGNDSGANGRGITDDIANLANNAKNTITNAFKTNEHEPAK